MSRSGSPPGVVEIDYGADETSALRKVGERISEEEFAERAALRQSAHELDLESTRGDHPSTSLSVNAYPTPRDVPLSSTRKERPLKDASEIRRPLSSRQKKERSKVNNQTWDRMPKTTQRAVHRLLNNDSEWAEINAALTANQGEANAVSDKHRAELHRVDRFIAEQEKRSGREHNVYVPLKLPEKVESARDVGSQVPARSLAAFDKYAAGKHSLHELDEVEGHSGVALEIQTRRGAYIGHSDSMDDTSHLLPRGMRLRIVGTRRVTYETPLGERRSTLVIQARDLTETKQQRADRQKLTKASRARKKKA